MASPRVLGSESSACQRAGPYLVVPGFTRDAHAPHINQYQHLEYLPLINARAHEVTAAAPEASTDDYLYGSLRLLPPPAQTAPGAALSRSKIQNKQFRAQYLRFMQYLAYSSSRRDKIATGHLISAVYYMLLQDRVPEAKKLFALLDARRTAANAASAAPVSPASSSGGNSVEMQLDYLTAYFDFFSLALGGPTDAAALRTGAARAVAIADKYAAYPVRFWRKLFAEVKAHVGEALETVTAAAEAENAAFAMIDADGNAAPAAAGPAGEAAAAALASGALLEGNKGAEDRAINREKELAALASTEPQLEFTVEKAAGAAPGAAPVLKLVHANVASCVVSFHLMDLEALFSANPFISGETDKFALVAPNHAFEVDLTGAVPSAEHGFHGVTIVPVPAKFATANVHIQVTAATLPRARSATHYAHSLLVQVVDAFGQVKVSAAKGEGAARVYGPLPGAYVKCFAKLKTGVVDFYKDGYTDLRGRFDFASLSTDKLKSVERFAILVVGDEFGACVKEAAPPSK